jgi:putative transposase
MQNKPAPPEFLQEKSTFQGTYQPSECVLLPTMVGQRRMNTVQHRRHTPEQVIRKLREADKLLAEGANIATVAKHLEVSEQTFHRWRNQYGGMKADDAKRLKELERENARLKHIVADQVLDIAMLKEVAKGNF